MGDILNWMHCPTQEILAQLDPEKQRGVLKKLTAVLNILKSTRPVQPKRSFKNTTDHRPRQRKIQPVVKSYPQFSFKKKSNRRAHPNAMNIKAFKDEAVRRNTNMSYTFVNDPDSDLKVGDISSQHLQGKHTTTYAEIFDLDKKTKLIDTPGIKGFGLINFEKQEIRDLFPEFLKYKNKCKFTDCLHLKEPNCFIKLMVSKNKISKSRYESYSQILADDNLKHR